MLLSFVSLTFAQDRDEAQFGTVHFSTSCNDIAQRRFDRAMRYQHSFWYRQSKEIFEETLKADPTCALAYWGIALSLLWNPHAAPPAANMPLGLAALEKGKTIGAKTARERDYIDALMALYADYQNVPRGRRVQAYLRDQGVPDVHVARDPQPPEPDPTSGKFRRVWTEPAVS